MTNIRKLLDSMAAQEAAFQETQFVAPCVRGGTVRARVAGLVQTFRPKPSDFEGWGVFRPEGNATAVLTDEAGLPLVDEYLKLLTPLRVRLVHALKAQTWLAYPVNEGDARQRLGQVRPFPIHLVTEGAPFEPILARGAGGVWWFAETDRRADPHEADRLCEALKQVTPPEGLRFPGLTPEMRTAYGLAAQQANEFSAQRQHGRDTRRLTDALRVGGGELRGFRDRGDFWQVEWTTRDGQRHTSAIGKGELTVMSSGICLSGRDHDFDLQSLVGVIERRDTDWDGY